MSDLTHTNSDINSSRNSFKEVSKHFVEMLNRDRTELEDFVIESASVTPAFVCLLSDEELLGKVLVQLALITDTGINNYPSDTFIRFCRTFDGISSDKQLMFEYSTEQLRWALYRGLEVAPIGIVRKLFKDMFGDRATENALESHVFMVVQMLDSFYDTRQPALRDLIQKVVNLGLGRPIDGK